MRCFVKLWGEVTTLSGTHEGYARDVKGLPLSIMLEDHARVHTHARHLVLETNQTHLTTSQKRSAGKIYKEYECIGWTIQVDGRYSTSGIHDCESRINWNKVKQIG